MHSSLTGEKSEKGTVTTTGTHKAGCDGTTSDCSNGSLRTQDIPEPDTHTACTIAASAQHQHTSAHTATTTTTRPPHRHNTWRQAKAKETASSCLLPHRLLPVSALHSGNCTSALRSDPWGEIRPKNKTFRTKGVKRVKKTTKEKKKYKHETGPHWQTDNAYQAPLQPCQHSEQAGQA